MLEFRPECPSRLAEEVGARVQAGSPTPTLTWSRVVTPEKKSGVFSSQAPKAPSNAHQAGRDQDGKETSEKGPGSSRRKKNLVFFPVRRFCQTTQVGEGARTQGVAGRGDPGGSSWVDISAGVLAGMPLQARGGSWSSSSGPESNPDPDPEQGRHAGKKVRLFFSPALEAPRKGLVRRFGNKTAR